MLTLRFNSCYLQLANQHAQCNACFIFWGVIMSHYAWNCSSQIMCKVQQWKQQNSNSYNRSCTGTISCKKQCSYTYHVTLSSCPTIKAPKNWNWGLNSLWTPRTLQNVAFRSSKILRWFEPNWNATLQVVFPIAVFPIAVDAFTSEEIYGLQAL